MKKLILTLSVILFVIMTAFVINGNLVSRDNTNTPYPSFQVTIYQTNGTTVQGSVEVIVYDSNNNPVEMGTTGLDGKIGWSWTHGYGDYTVKAWYPARPNDGQNGQRTVTYSGASINTSITLGGNY